MIAISRVRYLPVDELIDLEAEASASGFRGVFRLVDDWQSGRNRFDQPGEAVYVATAEGRIVGVCGLNRDPYLTDPSIGRIRHLYIANDRRRHGIGSRLVCAIMAEAKGNFARLRVRTNSPDADALYRALGFTPCTAESACTHYIVIAAQHTDVNQAPWYDDKGNQREPDGEKSDIPA
jgi:GNAT superfamily N-acetyltransferase